MKYTNKQNLPEALYQAIVNDPYKKGSDFSASELPTPPQIRVLKQRYDDKITIDVADLIYPLIGNNTHYILERIGIKNGLQEERLSWKFWSGFTVSGKLDFYDSMNVLWDYKVTTRYVLIDGVKPEWEAQLNTNALLLKLHNFTVASAKICTIFRDWSKIQAVKNPDYPKNQVVVLSARLWSMEESESYINERVKLHYQSEYAPDDQLPKCTSKERWEKPTVYAVMKKGRKSSVRNLESLKDAQAYIKNKHLDAKVHTIQKRLGESTRCEYYCDVKSFCNQYKELKTVITSDTSREN